MKSDLSDLDIEKHSTVVDSRARSLPDKSRTTSPTVPGPVTPWQERPVGCRDVMWRHAANPIIGRHHLPGVQGIYNSAVTAYGDGFVGVFRLEKRCRFPHLHVGWSDDGLDWHIEPEPIQFASGDPGSAADYAYDPRVCKIDGIYYITWCGGHNGPTISIASTRDFQVFDRMENAFLPFNRNGVLFPRKIAGKYQMLSRPSDDGHTP
jgi:beta-1,4-mannooligosaccharide/beta-1,4-mannosyl-N-acetylglucosamine phosphorylase